MRKKYIILLILNIAILIILIFLLFNVNNFFNKQSFSMFEPFSENNVLFKQEQSIKIDDNLPKIVAASAFYPFAANLVQNVYSENSYSKELLQLVSTSQAFEDIISGEADIAIATGPSDEQEELIEKSNVNLEIKTIYLEPLVILINKKNSIDNLSIEQIQDIYYGSNSNWNTYQLEKNNGSQTCFESIVKNNELGQNHYEINTMPKIVDKIASDKKSIGYAFYSYYYKMYTNNNAKVINVNNKDIKDTDYPLLFEVYLIYRIDNQNENISKIVNWLETEEGQEFIKNTK
jgi:phosphate transport system substrate-binding protein